MKIMKLIIITLSLICLIHCKGSQPAELPEVIIEENLQPVDITVNLEKRIPVTGVRYPFLFAGEQEVFAYGFSMDNPKLFVAEIYDKNLNFQSKKVLPFGQGPGDVGSGPHLYKFGEQIYVPDNTQLRVNIFDKSFNFKKFVKIGGGFATLIKEGQYIIKARPFTDHEKRERISKLCLYSFPDLKEKVLKEFKSPWPIDEKGRIIQYSQNGYHYFCHKNIIYVLDMNSYNICTYDFSGTPLQSIRIDVNARHLPEETRTSWLKEIRGGDYERIKGKVILTDVLQPASFMIPLSKGFAVIRRETYLLNCSGEKTMVTADYFDYQLSLKGQIQLPCFHRVFEVDYIPRTFQYNDGFLYLVGITEDEDYYLEKWSVVE